jgi:hypothetical protein
VGAHDNLCELPLAIWIEGERRQSYTTLRRSCAYGALMDTKALTPELRVHLSSDYLGYPDRTARSTHFSDVYERQRAARTGWRSAQHPPGELDVRWLPSGCLYDHLFCLLDLLHQLGRSGRIEVGDDVLRPFEALARGSSVAAVSDTPARLRSDLAAVRGAWALPGMPSQGYAQA